MVQSTPILIAKQICNTGDPFISSMSFHEVTKTGTIGHPDLASAEKGKRFLDGIVKDVTAFVDEFAKW